MLQYLMIEIVTADGIRNVPFIFPDIIKPADMLEQLAPYFKVKSAKGHAARVVSGGDCEIYSCRTKNGLQFLGVKARDIDQIILNEYHHTDGSQQR